MFNIPKEFYPTQRKTIEKLLEGVDFSITKTILEPSCGDGAIVDYIVEKTKSINTYRKINLDIDCIEIDENLRYILQGKNYKIVNDDFLTYNTYKAYQLIVMNPPFSNQEKHLKKALDMLELSGGEIRAIVNAEMVRNLYSNSRKEIINILNKNNASIEFFENEFSDARRETEVEIAIIKCKVEKAELTSVILENLKQAKVEKENTYESRYITTNNFIKAIIQQYDFECMAGCKLIEEYNKLKAFTSSDFNKESSILYLGLSNDRSYSVPTENNLKNSYLKKVRYKYWEALFNNKEFTKLFTSNLQRDFYNRLNELSDYDFNEFNIMEIKKQLNQQVSIGVKETILNLFDEFSHKHYWDKDYSSNIHYFNGWKSNSCWKINKKIITVINAFDDWNGGYCPTKYTCVDKLLDIEKVFNYLDSGKSEELDLREVLKKAKEEGQTKGIMSKFFKVDFFKKGSCHLTFLDEELLKKFNIFGALQKGWLPPSYSTKRYKDMSDEEKVIIDNFEGEKEYEKVISDVGYYIYDTNRVLMLG